MGKSQAWWYMPVTPALRRQRQEDMEFRVSLWYEVRLCLKKPRPYQVPVVHSCNPGYLGHVCNMGCIVILHKFVCSNHCRNPDLSLYLLPRGKYHYWHVQLVFIKLNRNSVQVRHEGGRGK
jgi:hypothetical protein